MESPDFAEKFAAYLEFLWNKAGEELAADKPVAKPSRKRANPTDASPPKQTCLSMSQFYLKFAPPPGIYVFNGNPRRMFSTMRNNIEKRRKGAKTQEILDACDKQLDVIAAIEEAYQEAVDKLLRNDSAFLAKSAEEQFTEAAVMMRKICDMFGVKSEFGLPAK